MDINTKRKFKQTQLTFVKRQKAVEVQLPPPLFKLYGNIHAMIAVILAADDWAERRRIFNFFYGCCKVFAQSFREWYKKYGHTELGFKIYDGVVE
jgi:hypothetical protein